MSTSGVAGVSVATVYNLVGTRERVLLSVLDGYVDRLRSTVDETPPGREPIESLVHAVMTAVELCLEDPTPLKAILRELGPLELAENHNLSLIEVLHPRLVAAQHLLRDCEPDTMERLLAYGFRGCC